MISRACANLVGRAGALVVGSAFDFVTPELVSLHAYGLGPARLPRPLASRSQAPVS
jgi:hypothetical protein